MNVLLRAVCNGYLDSLVRPEIHVRKWAVPSFQVCGCAGILSALVLSATMAVHQGLSPVVTAAVTLGATLTSLGIDLAIKVVTGEENFAHYYLQMTVVGTSTGLLWLLRQPVLSYLDLIVLGFFAFVVCGRVGCLMVGCCHGRPHRWGVCYREEHAEAGFPSHFVGVRLFPIQAIESLWALGLVVVGSMIIWSGSEPGQAVAWFVVGYAVGRFCFEFLRGDGVRPYVLGFSEAQWTALVVAWGVVIAGRAGWLPFRVWHTVVACSLAVAMVAVAVSQRFRRVPTHRLLRPRHVEEVAQALDPGRNPVPDDILVSCTSLGIQLSTGRVVVEGEELCHYAISHRQGAMNKESVDALAGLILRLKHPSHSGKVVKGNQGVFHLLVRD